MNNSIQNVVIEFEQLTIFYKHQMAIGYMCTSSRIHIPLQLMALLTHRVIKIVLKATPAINGVRHSLKLIEKTLY